MPIFAPPSTRGFIPQWMVFSTWTEHLPFAFDLIAALEPHRLVELGVYHGQSYFGFCQAITELGVDARCFGVDTWLGDKHTSSYDERIFREVNDHNEAFYAEFSTLMRTTFEEATVHFQDDSLDLIHLDGLHTYEAVSEDFTTWYPKLRPGGIFLFHDIRARLSDFGVWRFWEELTRSHETFAFDHGFGLGVLRKAGGDGSVESDLIRLLFSGDPAERHRLRRFYSYAARLAELERKDRHLRRAAEARSNTASDRSTVG